MSRIKQFVIAREGELLRVSEKIGPKMRPLDQLFEAGRGLLLISTRVLLNFTSHDDLTWRKNKVISLVCSSGLVQKEDIKVGIEQDSSGHFIGYLLLISGVSKPEARKILAVCGCTGTYFSRRIRSWSHIDKDREIATGLTVNTEVLEDEVDYNLPNSSRVPNAASLTSEQLFKGRGEDGLYRRGFEGLSQRELEQLDDAGHSWRSVFESHPPLKLFHLAASFGAGQIIRGRVAAAFEEEGFRPNEYLELCRALNSEPLSSHPENIFRSTNRFGGGKEGMEWVLRPSDFRVFPSLLIAGFTPQAAALLILDNINTIDDQSKLAQSAQLAFGREN